VLASIVEIYAEMSMYGIYLSCCIPWSIWTFCHRYFHQFSNTY